MLDYTNEQAKALTCKAGKRYALVCANSCVKTTPTCLHTGHYPAESGCIWW